ncbi:hypothetical protein [Staphylococcus epidermidis]|nr:hypothetical protein [Staphylococcus epidermidis]
MRMLQSIPALPVGDIKNILRLAMKKSMTIDFFIAIFYSYREK